MTTDQSSLRTVEHCFLRKSFTLETNAPENSLKLNVRTEAGKVEFRISDPSIDDGSDVLLTALPFRKSKDFFSLKTYHNDYESDESSGVDYSHGDDRCYGMKCLASCFKVDLFEPPWSSVTVTGSLHPVSDLPNGFSISVTDNGAIAYDSKITSRRADDEESFVSSLTLLVARALYGNDNTPGEDVASIVERRGFSTHIANQYKNGRRLLTKVPTFYGYIHNAYNSFLNRNRNSDLDNHPPHVHFSNDKGTSSSNNGSQQDSTLSTDRSDSESLNSDSENPPEDSDQSSNSVVNPNTQLDGSAALLVKPAHQHHVHFNFDNRSNNGSQQDSTLPTDRSDSESLNSDLENPPEDSDQSSNSAVNPNTHLDGSAAFLITPAKDYCQFVKSCLRCGGRQASGSDDSISSDRSYLPRRRTRGKQKNSCLPNFRRDMILYLLWLIIVILAIVTGILDPAGEKNWFKRLEESAFVLFTLGVPLIYAIKTNLTDELRFREPRKSRKVESLRELRVANKDIPDKEYGELVKRALLFDSDASKLFSMHNASYKLSKDEGSLHMPVHAKYDDTMKQVWKFGHTFALNRLRYELYNYTERNGVLYIARERVREYGIFVHTRRQLKEYYIGGDAKSTSTRTTSSSS